MNKTLYILCAVTVLLSLAFSDHIRNWTSPPSGANPKLTISPQGTSESGEEPTVSIPKDSKITVYAPDPDTGKMKKVEPQPEFTIKPKPGSDPSTSIELLAKPETNFPNGAIVVIDKIDSNTSIRPMGTWSN